MDERVSPPVEVARDIEILLAELRARGCDFRDRRQAPQDVVEKLKRVTAEAGLPTVARRVKCPLLPIHCP